MKKKLTDDKERPQWTEYLHSNCLNKQSQEHSQRQCTIAHLLSQRAYGDLGDRDSRIPGRLWESNQG